MLLLAQIKELGLRAAASLLVGSRGSGARRRLKRQDLAWTCPCCCPLGRVHCQHPPCTLPTDGSFCGNPWQNSSTWIFAIWGEPMAHTERGGSFSTSYLAGPGWALPVLR